MTGSHLIEPRKTLGISSFFRFSWFNAGKVRLFKA
jgi:hypothetical protein